MPPTTSAAIKPGRQAQQQVARARQHRDEGADRSHGQGGGRHGVAQVAAVDEPVVEDQGDRGGQGQGAADDHAGAQAEHLGAQRGDHRADRHAERRVDQRQRDVRQGVDLAADAQRRPGTLGVEGVAAAARPGRLSTVFTWHRDRTA